MIDYDMNKTQLRRAAGLSTNVMAKLSKDDFVSMETLLRICSVFRCDIGDILEVVEESSQLRMAGYQFDDNTNLRRVADSANSKKGAYGE